MDSRIRKMAKLLVDYSCQIKKGEYVEIHASPKARNLVLALEEAILQRGAYYYTRIRLPGEYYVYYKYATEEQLTHFPHLEKHDLKYTQCLIAILDDVVQTSEDDRELAGADPQKINLRMRTLAPLRHYRSKNIRWCVTLFPTLLFARRRKMMLGEFQDFVFSTLFLEKEDPIQEWQNLSAKQQKLITVLAGCRTVKIIGRETDLSFSIQGRKFINSDGRNNMPSGEIYTSPLESSTEGQITFLDFPVSVFEQEIQGVKLEFKKGKAVKASAEKNEESLLTLLNTDEGARYLGEFGIGTNSGIKRFIGEMLFDEKIGGTIHLALGSGFSAAGGRNKSGIHRDMIFDLKQGGELWIDDKRLVWNGEIWEIV